MNRQPTAWIVRDLRAAGEQWNAAADRLIELEAEVERLSRDLHRAERDLDRFGVGR